MTSCSLLQSAEPRRFRRKDLSYFSCEFHLQLRVRTSEPFSVREGNYRSVSRAQSLSLKMAFSTVARRGYDKSPENDSRLEKLNKKMDNILERDDR
ncbi:hypothetical protein E4U10_007237 [Claviceps purpurea]|nr:hypothetical protein E4U10_007237 [Claviceps purpurea]